ncbi:bifunctional 5,10-methylenetetrahydrofolate dehydrogenase/5,10-methenyltetrahydrofolate cyclohydrolase [Aminipila luticellarii]|uniref:Bifunctional protein FolD n=1 Tax=Aminipila luticellarii TaxID=2507160 RepID=A0A410PTY9_9FIRM|nr:tetrahydrofolate dehydrogenase/cyclohydrolase catalytic domain-containing protein [Aminipila luticellarii]QAT42395.1 bifunctional 5,10-methylene-tetrahydrofolate dehydrogenase/5,10-methylene-tetrahydrofolate cyclohydrolase [Aminipila luticellarii]
MAQILNGREVVDAVNERLRAEVLLLKEKGITPTLGIIRVGAKVEDVSYEKGAIKCAESIGVDVKKYLFKESITQEQLLNVIAAINLDLTVHGVILFRPLPDHIDDNTIRKALLACKDVDGITDQSMAGVYTGTDLGYPPCTPRACIEILDHYGIDITGKTVAVIGRSLVVGRPAAMMVLEKNGTPVICHTKTEDMETICRNADVLIVSAGQAKAIGAEYLSEKQVVIDVGINMTEDGKLCGDVDFEAAQSIVKAITPVPGGVGKVTTSLLMMHVIDAAKKTI